MIFCLLKNRVSDSKFPLAHQLLVCLAVLRAQAVLGHRKMKNPPIFLPAVFILVNKNAEVALRGPTAEHVVRAMPIHEPGGLQSP